METFKKFGSLILFLSFLLGIENLDAQKKNKKLDIKKEEKAIRRKKLQKLNKESFQNRTNVKADEKTRLRDVGIGKTLSQKVTKNPTDLSDHMGIEGTRKESDEESKFGGDILSLTEKANFGHINAIVRVVSGYVMDSFNYNQEDSELLALYIVYYNLKHRKNIEYMEANFDKDLVSKLEKERVGIPDKFEGWQGQTQILLPIEKNVLKGGGLDIATYELEDQVNPDIDAQKDGAVNKKRFANLQVKKIKEEKKESLEKFDEILKREKELQDKKKSLEDELAELMKDPEKNKARIAQLQAELKKVDSELNEVTLAKKDMEEKMSQIGRREEMRKMGFTSEKEFLAYQASQKKSEPEKKDTPVVKKDNPPVVEEVKVEEVVEVPPPKKITKKYDISFHTRSGIIAGRESLKIPGVGIVVIGYKLPYKNPLEISLFVVSSGDMNLVKESEGVKLHEDSPFQYSEGKFYVFEELAEKVYLSQINEQMELEYRSSVEIDPDSTIMILENAIHVIKNNRTDSPSDTQKFNKKDLTPLTE